MHVREDRLRLLVAMARAAPEAKVGLLVAAFGPGALADDPPADVRSGSEQPLGLGGQRVAGRIAQHHPAFHRFVRRAERCGRLALRRVLWRCLRQPRQRHEDGHGEDWFEDWFHRSEEHTSELQSLMRISYAVFCLKKKNKSQT